MHALILAAGFGTRLKEFGETTPKGLISTKEGTLVEKVIDELLPVVPQLALVTNERFFSTYTQRLTAYGDRILYLNDGATAPENRRGAIGDILFTLEQLGWWEEDLLVVPSDTYYEFSLQEFVQAAQVHQSFATVLRDVHDPNLIALRLGCAVIQGDSIVEFVEKPANPPSTLAAIPFYYYPQATFQLLKQYAQQGRSLDAPGSIIPWFLSQKIPIYAYVTDGKTIDVGTMDDVATVKEL